jgi:hypothetical protein
LVEDKSVFISSCTRRQLARRRPTRSVLRLQLLILATFVAAAFGAFIAGHGGL